MNLLPEEIIKTKENFEYKINMKYPYQRFSIIEVPVRFYTYPHPWTLYQETVQPAQVLLLEKGFLLLSSDFKKREYACRKIVNPIKNARTTLTAQVIRTIFRRRLNIFFDSFTLEVYSFREHTAIIFILRTRPSGLFSWLTSARQFLSRA